MSKQTKEIALKSVLLSMEEVRKKLEISAVKEDTIANAEAMRMLADAFARIAESR